MNFRTQHQKPSARRIAAFAALPIVAALALTGCASDDSDDDTGSAGSGSVGSSATDPAGTGTGTGASSSGSASSGSNKALLAAVATARGEVGSGTVISVEQEQGASAYEVLVVTKDGTEHEVHTNADGSAVAGTPQTEAADADDKAEHERFVAAADLSVKQAVDAFQDLHAGTVTELGLDDHVGTVVWEGDVLDSSGTKHSVRIDAGSGDVVTDRVDTDD
ncbi:PepSY domain-containing protein [Curtobacterium flaccumfaciens pv. flaccumfaciens]|uniref:PepSY domain-containing protein n=1 Tax=Curtobacterium flaccumfaciens TaxID=2035 RepID=UPI00217DCEE8|nr:PepSY domain-containing protein [Curtobacterium flaccumfaciens]MCS6554898.1 PepSY domain-containing protein [Curtobacterium flaccumfaciens]QYI97371.1 PepSY domain-containing protein [Curtobacterium flaccumfaciens pv. flaccumfaciens]UXN22848.1 PepSY domain-containing protein [Curtobacterium flaccumfaciens pv. flaccumfaciens]